MKNKNIKNSYFAVGGMFYALSVWDLFFHKGGIDIVFLGLGVTFTCLGLIAKKKSNKTDKKDD